MIEFILGSFLYAKYKKLSLRPIIKSWEIYLPLFFMLFYIFLEITIWLEWYFFIPYTQIIKTATLLSYLPLAIRYKLYEPSEGKKLSPLLTASVFLFLGSQLNRLAVWANNGYMPVFPSVSYWTGYTKPEMFNDGFHVLGNASTKAIILVDLFDAGYCIMSFGDLLIRLSISILIYFSIKGSNKNCKDVKKENGI